MSSEKVNKPVCERLVRARRLKVVIRDSEAIIQPLAMEFAFHLI